jgi:arsenate reductase
MSEKLGNVLFLCTRNAGRSVMAEALLDHWSKGRFKGYSAGVHPSGRVHPMALVLVTELGEPTDSLRSKSWDEFAAPGAPHMDYIFTVCDQAAGETCPVWPGHPITANWAVPNPIKDNATRTEEALAFREAFRFLETRIRYFLTFRFKELDRGELQRMSIEAGQLHGEKTA